jgi:hypothetical protein
MEEIWKPVLGYEGLYDVSNLGRVRSYRKKWQGEVCKYPQFIKKPKMTIYGYIHIRLSSKTESKWCSLHRVVLKAFTGPCPKGMQCCHKDNNKSNNSLDNLCWGTPSSNQSDYGTQVMGEKHWNHKLFPLDILCIRELKRQGKSTESLEVLYKMSKSNILRISKGDVWKHIPLLLGTNQ